MQGAKHQVAGKARLDTDRKRLGVAHFTDHHDVRVLAKEGAHDTREGHFLADHTLRDVSVEFVFDRVFGGDDIFRFRVERVKRRIQGRGLSRTGWTGNKDEAVWHLNCAGPLLQDFFVHAELRQFDFHRARVEKTHNELFAVETRDTRGTGAEPAAVILHVDTSVLRLAVFIDTHAGSQFQARDNVLRLLSRKGTVIVKDAVLAIADLELIAFWLKVDVARSGVKRLHEDGIGDADRHG